MRIVFDQNVPVGVRRAIQKAGHQVVTAPDLGWEEIKNGFLLKAAEASGFDVMVSADQNLTYQQNLAGRRISLVVLGSKRWPFVKKHVPEIVAAVNAATPNSYAFIEIRLPPKRPYFPFD